MAQDVKVLVSADRRARRQHVSRLLELASLPPTLVESILAGTQPADMTAETLARGSGLDALPNGLPVYPTNTPMASDGASSIGLGSMDFNMRPRLRPDDRHDLGVEAYVNQSSL